MKSEKPIVRKVDGVGRVSVSPKLLDNLQIEEGSSVLFYMENENEIILKADNRTCVFCGNSEIVVHASEIEICPDCRGNPDNISAIINQRYEKQIIPIGRRIVIPFKIRHQLEIVTGDKIEMIQNIDCILMKKVTE